MPKKKSTSFHLSALTLELLKSMADLENRSQANMFEVVVKEAAKKRGLYKDKS